MPQRTLPVAPPLDLLKSGGLVPANAKLKSGEPTDAVVIRSYRHPVLGRSVVRLSAQPLAAGDDLEMELLGFEAPTSTGPVALQRQRALGFPAWPLAHDPKNARYALEVVKELKRQVKIARSKPGAARDGFEAIADRLARSVPQFLPSFYEEVGRAFIECGNQGFAASSFAKAREAERVHALSVDENVQATAFLEFALAGALTGKALGELASELAQSADPKGAYERFRELCTRRALGGMPPWTGMGKDLRRLAKLAKLDLDAEDRRLIEEVLEAPSIARAPLEFWTTYQKAIVALAKQKPAVRGALLKIIPEGSGDRPALITQWIALLDESSASAGLIDPKAKVPDEASCDSAAKWFAKLLGACAGWYQRAPDAVFELLRRMAPRLEAERETLDLAAGRWRTLDLDIIEQALELGLSIADPPPNAYLDLNQWAQPLEGSKERWRDPVHVAADERFKPLLTQRIGNFMGKDDFEARARGKKGFVEARKAWFDELLDSLEGRALHSATASQQALTPFMKLDTWVEFPHLRPRLEKVSMAAVLGRTLRAGVFDEVGWPELERAMEELDAQGKARLTLGGAFPYLIICNGSKAIVVGPRSRALEHDLNLPAKAALQSLHWAEGQLLVIYRDPSTSSLQATWTGQPNLRFEPKGNFYDLLTTPAVELPGGGVFRGGRAFRAGDTEAPVPLICACDGKTYWKGEHSNGRFQMREVDPISGAPGRLGSLPTFFESFAAEGWALDLARSRLFPAPGLEGSPAGWKDGLTGFRVRVKGAVQEAETVDGLRWSGDLARNSGLCGLLRLPGRKDALGVSADYSSLSLVEQGGEVLCYMRQGVNGRKPDFAQGTPLVPPSAYLSVLQWRDEAGSLALRSLSDDQAQALLSAGKLDVEAKDAGSARARAKLEELVPSLKNPRLVDGVVGIIRCAASVAINLASGLASSDPTKAPATTGAGLVSLAGLASALAPLMGDQRGSVSGPIRLAGELAEVEAFLERGQQPQLQNFSLFAWEHLLGRLSAVAFLAVAPFTPPEGREAALLFLETLATSALADPDPRRRLARVNLPRSSPMLSGLDPDRPVFTGAHSGSRYLVRKASWNHDPLDLWVLEKSGDASFRLPPQSTPLSESTGHDGFGREALRAFAKVARQRGPLAFKSDVAEELAQRTGITRAEAALLWAGLPNIGSWTHDFLGKSLREQLGIKVTEANAAKEALKSTTSEFRSQLLGAAVLGDLEGLWDPKPNDDGGPVARVAEVWNQKMGKRAVFPPELLVAAKRELPVQIDPTRMISAIQDPLKDESFARDGVCSLVEGTGSVYSNDHIAWKVRSGEPAAKEVFSLRQLTSAAAYFPFMFSVLPVGNSIRDGLPRFLETVRKRMSNTDLIIEGGWHWMGEVKPAEAEAQIAALLEGIGGDAYPPGGSTARGRDNGLVIAAVAGKGVRLAFRPAALPKALGTAHEKLMGTPTVNRWLSPGQAATALLSDGFSAMGERVRKTPVPSGSWEANPLHAAPGLVERVAKAQKLSPEAAGLYLQTLALLAPSSKSVQSWNGWTPGTYQKAAQELVSRDLVVEAKRARTGRAHFLPGGWEDLGSPDTPFESWKMPLYGLAREGNGIVRPLGAILPLQPTHLIFEEAWKRIEAGDLPRYEEVKRVGKKDAAKAKR